MGLRDAPNPFVWGKNLPGLLNDLHSSHSWEVKEEVVQLCSLTRSDDQAVLVGRKPDTEQSIITMVIKVKTVSFSVTGFL